MQIGAPVQVVGNVVLEKLLDPAPMVDIPVGDDDRIELEPAHGLTGLRGRKPIAALDPLDASDDSWRAGRLAAVYQDGVVDDRPFGRVGAVVFCCRIVDEQEDGGVSNVDL